jgi:hypothetical protein
VDVDVDVHVDVDVDVDVDDVGHLPRPRLSFRSTTTLASASPVGFARGRLFLAAPEAHS